jgi:hypothetical protein
MASLYLSSLRMYFKSEAPTFLNALQFLFTTVKLPWMRWRRNVDEENICVDLGVSIFPWHIVFFV